MRQCIAHAIEHNINIRQQNINVENNKVMLSTARNQRLPGVSASASENVSFGRGLTADNTYTNTNTSSTSLSLGAQLPIWDGGQMENNVAMRRINLNAALADLQKAREDVSLRVASAFLDVLYQKELLAVNKRQVELSKMQQERIAALFENGKRAEADLAEAKATVANDLLSLTQQENAVKLSLLELSQLLELDTPEGFDVAAPTELDATDAINPDAVFAEAQLSRPQIEAEKLRLESAQKQVAIAKSGYMPSLNLSGGLGSNYYTTSGFKTKGFGEQLKNNFSQYIGVNLNIPIFNRFATRNQVKQARLQVENQQLTLENTRKALYKEIQQAYYNAVAANRQYDSSLTAEEAAQTSFRLVEKKYENGKATATEYSEAKTRYQGASSRRLQAKYTALFRSKILNFYRGIALE